MGDLVNEDENININLDNYIDSLEYFKPQSYVIGTKELESFRRQDKDQIIKIVKAMIKNRAPDLYEVFETEISNNEKLCKYLFDILKGKTIIEKQMISPKVNVDKFNMGSPQAFFLDLLEKDILSHYDTRLVGMMTTVTIPPTYSFHDAWLICEKLREISLNIIKEYSVMAVSTVEYMHSGNKNYRMKGKKQIEWYQKLLSESDVNKQSILLAPTGIKDNDFGIERLTDSKMPYLYYPGENQSTLSFNNLIRFYKIIRRKFTYIHDDKKRLYTKDFFRVYYGDQFDTYKQQYNQNKKIWETVPACSPFFCGEVDNVSRKELLQSLFNYFNIILFSRRNPGVNSDCIDTSMVDFCQIHYRRIRDTYNSTDPNKLNIILDEYFPIHKVSEIGVAKGIFEINRDGKYKLKVTDEEYKKFLRIHNNYEFSNKFYTEFTFFTFLAFQHRQNGLSNVGYPHIHIYFLVEAVDHKNLNEITREVNTRISFATGLCNGKAVLTVLKVDETYVKGIGYITKNDSSAFVDKMLSQIDENGNRIRTSKDPILYVDYYDDRLYDLTAHAWLNIIGEANDGKITNWSYANDYIPLKLRKYKTSSEIYRLIIREFYPERVPKLLKLEEKELIDDKIFNIKYAPTDYKNEKSVWINYLQHYMVSRKLIINEGYIYQKSKDGKYTFDLYFPKDSNGEISSPDGWDASIKCFIQSFSNNISPKPPSKTTEDNLIKIFENTTPGYTENKYHFPCVILNMRLVEYEDFILDIISRKTYTEQVENQYCFLYIPGINRDNILPKIDEMLSSTKISFEDFQSGKSKRTIIGLLKHLGLYNKYTLSLLYDTLNVRFGKNGLSLFAGDRNSYKSKMLLLVYCLFPPNKIGHPSTFDHHDVGHQVQGKLALVSEEGGAILENIAKQNKSLSLNIFGGEDITGDKKFKDPKTCSSAQMSVSFCVNINGKLGESLEIPEVQTRINPTLHRIHPGNPGVVTIAEYKAILGELLYFVCMVSLSRDYFNYEKVPILHHHDRIPEPLERMHKYFLNNCNPKFLVKDGEPDRSALDIRDFEFNSILTHSFYESVNLPGNILKTKEEIFTEIIKEAENKTQTDADNKEMKKRKAQQKAIKDIPGIQNNNISNGGYTL